MTKQPALWEEAPLLPSKKRVQGGVATSDVIVSAQCANNARVFADVAALHLPSGGCVADITYGKGVFWQQIPTGRYCLQFSDLDAKVSDDRVHGVPVQTGIDSRALPFADAFLDGLVFDPPYMEGLFRPQKEHLAGAGTHKTFREHYSNGAATPHEADAPRWHDAVLDLYLKTGREAFRVLKAKGIFVVKCQDEVSANRQRLTHIRNYHGLRIAWLLHQRFVCRSSSQCAGYQSLENAGTRPQKPLVFFGLSKGEKPL